MDCLVCHLHQFPQIRPHCLDNIHMLHHFIRQIDNLQGRLIPPGFFILPCISHIYKRIQDAVGRTFIQPESCAHFHYSRVPILRQQFQRSKEPVRHLDRILIFHSVIPPSHKQLSFVI